MNDNGTLTVKRPKRERETTEYAAFVRRAIRAFSRRVSAGDVEALADMVATSRELDQAIAASVKGLHEFGYSYAEIGQRLGVSRQAVQQRWGSLYCQLSAHLKGRQHMPDRLGELMPLPGTDIDWAVSGPLGIVLIEHKYPYQGGAWQPLTQHQLVIYKDLAKSPRVRGVIVARFDPNQPEPDLWVAFLGPNITDEDQLKFARTNWNRFRTIVAQATGLNRGVNRGTTN